MRFIENSVQSKGNHDAVIPLPFLEGSIAVLGLVVAIILNAAFVFIILFRKSIRKPVSVSPIIVWFNILMLPVQVWYQFFYH